MLTTKTHPRAARVLVPIAASRASTAQSGDATGQIALFPTALGWMAVLGEGSIVRQLTFGHAAPDAALAALDPALGMAAHVGRWNPRLVRRLEAYAAGAVDDFRDVAIDPGPQTPFQARVIENCRCIGFGRTLSYRDLAVAAGYPRAARAVGNVMRANRISLIVPCHRVVASQGGMGGYSAGEGTRMKLRLLEMESRGRS